MYHDTHTHSRTQTVVISAQLQLFLSHTHTHTDTHRQTLVCLFRSGWLVFTLSHFGVANPFSNLNRFSSLDWKTKSYGATMAKV